MGWFMHYSVLHSLGYGAVCGEDGNTPLTPIKRGRASALRELVGEEHQQGRERLMGKGLNG